MTALAERGQVITLVAEAVAAGARQGPACAAISLSERTIQRWQLDQLRGDQRPMRVQEAKNRLSELERNRSLKAHCQFRRFCTVLISASHCLFVTSHLAYLKNRLVVPKSYVVP